VYEFRGTGSVRGATFFLAAGRVLGDTGREYPLSTPLRGTCRRRAGAAEVTATGAREKGSNGNKCRAEVVSQRTGRRNYAVARRKSDLCTGARLLHLLYAHTRECILMDLLRCILIDTANRVRHRHHPVCVYKYKRAVCQSSHHVSVPKRLGARFVSPSIVIISLRSRPVPNEIRRRRCVENDVTIRREK